PVLPGLLREKRPVGPQRVHAIHLHMVRQRLGRYRNIGDTGALAPRARPPSVGGGAAARSGRPVKNGTTCSRPPGEPSRTAGAGGGPHLLSIRDRSSSRRVADPAASQLPAPLSGHSL